MSTLVSVAQFRASKYNDPNWTDEEIQEALDYAEGRFYRLTNRDHIGYFFVARAGEFTLDGTGADYLRVPWPLLDLTSVQLVDNSGAGTDITADVRWRGHYLWYDDGFTAGFCNVIVQGTFGDPRYAVAGQTDTVPVDVQDAVCRLAELKLRRGRTASERVLDRRPLNPGGENPPPPTITGDREVDAIIKSYFVDDLTGSFDFR